MRNSATVPAAGKGPADAGSSPSKDSARRFGPSIVGGELKGLTKQLMQSREEAMERLVEAASARGADAILAMRFDANEVGQGYQEIVAYGTAVKVARRG